MLTILTSPVSRSISTSHACAPFGHEGVEGVCVALTRNMRFACRAASSPSSIARSVPAMRKRPSRYSMSAAAASSASAASAFASTITRRPAATTAEPPTKAEREPTLPTPLARSVSPCTIFTFSAGTPKTSVTSCVYEVSSPCPIACVPEKTVISPFALTCMSTVSVGSAPVHSR